MNTLDMKTTTEEHEEDATLLDSMLFDEFLMSLCADDNDTFGAIYPEVTAAAPMVTKLDKTASLRTEQDRCTLEPVKTLPEEIHSTYTTSWERQREHRSSSEVLQLTANEAKRSTCKPIPSTTSADTTTAANATQKSQQTQVAELCLFGQVGKMAAAGCCNRKSRTLPPDFSPSNYDVICLGRGKSAASHPGNRRFQITIQLYLDRYASCRSKIEKSLIVSEIVDTVRENSQMGGFVKRDRKTGAWFEVGDSVAREKVGQALRDSLSTSRSRTAIRRKGKASTRLHASYASHTRSHSWQHAR